MAALPTSTFSARYLERAISTLAWRRTTTPFVYLCYTSLVGDGHHQKYECDTNFFVCLLVHRYRIDALPLPLPLVCFAPHCGLRTEFLPCVTDPLVNARPGRRIAQAALKSCGSFEQRRDLGTCPTFISLSAELVWCRTSRQRPLPCPSPVEGRGASPSVSNVERERAHL